MKSLKDRIQVSAFRNEHQKALLNLYHTVFCMQHNEKQFLHQFRITSQQYNVLKILKGQGKNPISIKEIRSRMLDRFSDTGRIVNRLEKKGWVDKRISQFDKRATHLVLSNKGAALLQKIDMHPLDDWNTGIHQLSEQEAKTLNKLLQKIDF